MSYDFDSVIERRGTDSIKWAVGEGELPMWVADMDFKTAPEITEAILYRDEAIPGKIKRLQEVGRLLEYDSRREKQFRATHPDRTRAVAPSRGRSDPIVSTAGSSAGSGGVSSGTGTGSAGVSSPVRAVSPPAGSSSEKRSETSPSGRPSVTRETGRWIWNTVSRRRMIAA